MLRRLLRRGEPAAPQPPPDPATLTTSPADAAILERALPLTMTGRERTQALIDATRHLVRTGVPGAFAECGVWLGGSVVAMALTLIEEGASDRELWLYDTFEGMTRPGEHDVSPIHPPAAETWEEAHSRGERAWPGLFDPERFNQDAVRETVLATGYPAERVHIVKGAVEQTIPGSAPERLALLRLDTDWYASTRHEMTHLYPRLSPGGVLIVDDYGHWEGSRRAVEEHFAAHGEAILLHRIDYAARIGVRR